MMQDDSPSNTVKASLRDVMFVIFSKMHVLLGTLFVVVSISMGISFFVSPVYEVSATIMLKPFVDPNLQLQTTAPVRIYPVSQQDINSEIKIMTSEELLRRIVEQLGLDQSEAPLNPISRVIEKLRAKFSIQPNPADKAVVRLRNKLKIKPITLSNMIQVSLKGNDPDQITKIVNAFADRYIDYHIEVHKVRGAIEFYSQQATLYSNKLVESEDRLQAFGKKWKLIEIKSQRAANLELLRMLRETLSMVNSKIAERQSKVYQLKKDMHADGRVTAMTDELRNNPLIIELTRAMIPLMVEKRAGVITLSRKHG